MESSFGFMLVVLIAVIIVGMIICTGMAIIDVFFGYDLEDVTIECVITHMDIDDGCKFITVVGDNFSKTIEVSSEEYAKYVVGDSCIILQEGRHRPIYGDVFTYKIIE